MQDSRELKVGVCGIHGFAAAAANYVRRYGGEAQPRLRLSSVCDPAWQQHADRVGELREDGVEVLARLEQMLCLRDIAGVWLPVPIDLHRPFTEQALAQGKHVLCEKPAAGCIDDVDAMIAARDASGLSVLLGFQDAYDPTTAQLKRLILDGCIGQITHATLHACRPRGSWYFTRSEWAGRIHRDGRWVLDSPANNAVAHFINLILVLLGPSFHESATPVDIEAELYRAASIENYDTISARATLAGGAEFLILLTHACERETEPIMRIHGEDGLIECESTHWRIVTKTGEKLLRRTRRDDLYGHMMDAWSRAMTNRPDPDCIVATLENARQHTLVTCGASEATDVIEVDEDATYSVSGRHGDPVVAIRDIESAFEYCAANNKMLHESRRLTFTKPAGRFDLRDYKRFSEGRTPDESTLSQA